MTTNKINRVIETIPSLYQDKGFKDFKASGELSLKKQTCIDYAKGKLTKPSLVLCGNVGNGKTHLAVAIAKNFYLPKHKIVIRFIDADEFFFTLTDLASIGKSKLQYINELMRYDLLILDDLGIANFTPAKQENLYFLINKYYQTGKRLIITTNFTMEDLEQIDARVPSRLHEMATIISFHFNDYRFNK